MGLVISSLLSVAFVATGVMPVSGSISGAALVDTAQGYVGTPYCRGGVTSDCFDCSGFTSFVYDKNGVNLSRTAQQQYRLAEKITRSEAVPGDLVFFIDKSGYVYHVGIYLGNNKIIHSPRYGRDVRVETIWSTRVVFGRVAPVSS
jgi:cell wall-associated NlpC family hydrolase